MCLPGPGKLLDKIIPQKTFLGHVTAPLAHPFDAKSYKYNAWDDMRRAMTPADVAPVAPVGGSFYQDAGKPVRSLAPIQTQATSAPVRKVSPTLSTISAPSVGLSY